MCVCSQDWDTQDNQEQAVLNTGESQVQVGEDLQYEPSHPSGPTHNYTGAEQPSSTPRLSDYPTSVCFGLERKTLYS